MVAELAITMKLILLIIIFIFIVKWTKDATGSKILAILGGLIITYLVFSHEELAIIAIVIYFLIPNVLKPLLQGIGAKIED